MGTRKQINLRISGSRVLGRLKKSCKCCGSPDIHAIHLLPTAYPSKKISKFKREEKKRKQILKTHLKIYRRRAEFYVLTFLLFKRKNIKPIRKNSFSPSLCFLLLIFSYSIFSLSSNLHIKLEKKRNILKEKKKSITNQEDGTSFPPHKILKHLKDLKILSDPKI